ncbi:methylmalonate-semialdehyde dehydrogenase, partial [Streptomyces nanshensis]
MKTLGHWIGNKPVESASGNVGPVYDPATGAQPTQVALASVQEVDAAVAAAAAACPEWSQSSLARRTAFLFKYRELLDARRDEIAALITAEHGKVHSDALGEVARGMEILELACGIPEKLKGELSTQVSTRVDVS